MESKNLRTNVSSLENKPAKSGNEWLVNFFFIAFNFKLFVFYSDLNSLAGKLQNRNGKKRENSVVPKSGVGALTGPVPAGFKNQKPWLSKQKGQQRTAEKQQRNAGFTGSGTHRKNDYQVIVLLYIF